MSARYAHTDVKVPNFDAYRNNYTENAAQSSKENADDKQTFSYISTFGTIEFFFMRINLIYLD